MAANYYGAMHGKTGITSAGVVNELAKSLATGEGSNTDYLNELALKHQLDAIGKANNMDLFFDLGPMNQKGFRSKFMKRYNVSPYEKNRRRLIEDQKRAQLKKQMDLQSQSNINAQKAQIGMPPNLTPPKIIPKHSPHGGGPGSGDKGTHSTQGRDRGRARGRGETGQIAGGHHFNRGGLIDFYRYGGFVG